MNSVILIGRLTRDPEVRYSQNNLAIASFTVAIDRGKDRNGNDQGADFPRVTVFGRQAENCEKYLAKGRLVGVQGRIQTGSYVNRDGKTVYTTDVVADRIQFLEWGDRNNAQGDRSDNQNRPPEPVEHQAPPQNDYQEQMPAQGFMPLDDEDLPF